MAAPKVSPARIVLATLISVIALALLIAGWASQSSTAYFATFLTSGAVYCEPPHAGGDPGVAVPPGIPPQRVINLATANVPGARAGQSLAARSVYCVPHDPKGDMFKYAPIGVGAGDIIDLRDQSVASRIHMLVNQTKIEGPVELRIRNGDAVRSALVWPDATHLQNAAQAALVLTTALFVIFGLFVLWRGRDAAAVWLGLFCVSLAPTLAGFYGLLPAGWMLAAFIGANSLEFLAYFSLFAMADQLTRPFLSGPIARGVRVTRIAAALATIFALVLFLASVFAGVAIGVQLPAVNATLDFLTLALQIVVFCVAPLVILYAGSVHATERVWQTRLRVVLVTTAIGLSGPLVSIATAIVHGATPQFGWTWFTIVAIPLGFAYAILAYRVVDVGFVLNRVLEYSILLTFVVGAMALADVLAGEVGGFIAGRGPAGTSGASALLVKLVIAFIVVFSLMRFHNWLEPLLKRTFFRKRYAALETINTLCRQVHHVVKREPLLDRVVHDVRSALGASKVGVYEVARGGYRCTRDEPPGAFTQRIIDPDKAPFVEMRTDLQPVDLAAEHSELADAGLAFPMVVAGKLLGALVCGPRSDEEFEGVYAPDEREALETLAVDLGESLYGLKASENAEFVRQVAEGALNGSTARERALALKPVTWDTTEFADGASDGALVRRDPAR